MKIEEISEANPETLEFQPFAYALLQDELDHFCWYCLENRGEMKRCTACKVAFFCDKECQLLGWPDHKVECKAFTNLSEPRVVPSVDVRMLGRIVTRYKTILTGKDKDTPYFYLNRTSERAIMDLAHHAEDMRKDARAYKQFEELHDALKAFYGERALLEKEVVFQLHCRNFINRHAISDVNYMQEIGKGLYLDLCAYDHSCRPNVIYTCKGLVATLRPLHSNVDIRNKKTTFYTYIDLISHKAQRRKDLQDTWYFHCECERCMDETENVLTATICPKCGADVHLFGALAKKDSHTLDVSCSSCLETLTKEHVVDAMQSMKFIDGVLSRNEVDQMTKPKARQFIDDFLVSFRGRLLPTVNIYFARLLQQAIFICVPEETERLLGFHVEAERCMRVCFPPNHPALAYHLMNIGIFYHRMEKKRQAAKYLKEAKAMIDFALGSEHPMAQTAKGYLEEA